MSTAAAMAIERTTSANSTVTCLYSAWVSGSATGEPQPWQNLSPARSSAPHDLHTVPVAVIIAVNIGLLPP